MKKITTLAALVLIALCASLSIAAQLPSGLQAKGQDTSLWEKVILAGTITSVVGDEVTLEVDGQPYTINGVAPQWFWDDLYPEGSPLVSGTFVTVNCYLIDHLDEIMYVAITITFGDDPSVDPTVQVRDDITMVPLWTGRYKK